MTASASALDLAGIAARAADSKLGEDIAVIDVSGRLVITDVFVVVTGDNERHVGALIDAVEDAMKDAGHRPIRREGTREGRWGLLDYGECVVHVFRREERVFYGLDRLWRDCPLVPVDGVEGFSRPTSWDAAEVVEIDSLEDLPLAGPTPDEGEL